MRAYSPALLTSPGLAVASVIVFVVPMILLILMSIFRNYLANIDKMIAAYMRYGGGNPSTAKPLPFDIGFIHYLNITELAIIIIPVLYVGSMLGIFWAATKTRNLLPYLYTLVAATVYIGLANLFTLILKVALNRPRPRQIAEFTTADNKPIVSFKPIFSRYTGPNPAHLKLYSTPSGHTMLMASSLFPLPILTFLLAQMYKRLRQDSISSDTSAGSQNSSGTYMLWLIFFYLATAVTATFAIIMPIVMAYARLAASAHFLTDTITAMLLAILCLVLIFVSIPDLRALDTVTRKSSGNSATRAHDSDQQQEMQTV